MKCVTEIARIFIMKSLYFVKSSPFFIQIIIETL